MGTKTGLFACQKQLYNWTTVMPPSPSTHTCAHCPSESSWVISFGGRAGKGLNEWFMGKSAEYWYLKISHLKIIPKGWLSIWWHSQSQDSQGKRRGPSSEFKVGSGLVLSQESIPGPAISPASGGLYSEHVSLAAGMLMCSKFMVWSTPCQTCVCLKCFFHSSDLCGWWKEDGYWTIL